MAEFDLQLEWGQDLVLTASGSLATVTGWDRIRERVIRRILTNPSQILPDASRTPADYAFDTAYGIGGGALVSQNPTQTWLAALRQRIRAGVLADSAVDQSFDPQVTITQPTPTMMLIIVAFQLRTGQAGTFSIATG